MMPLFASGIKRLKTGLLFTTGSPKITLHPFLRLEKTISRSRSHACSYKEIAKRFNISVGRLKNIMLEIYEKLYISRDELAQYVLIVNKGTGENHRRTTIKNTKSRKIRFCIRG